MASAKNPNTVSRRKQNARATAKKKVQLKAAYQKRLETKHKITKAQASKGARPGLLPTSGAGSSVSRKKQRKLEKKMGYAMKRKVEGEGEVEMQDLGASKKSSSGDGESARMEVDGEDIS